MTTEEAFEMFYDYMDLSDEDYEKKWGHIPVQPSYMERVHGKLIEYRQEAYADVKVYEDGYEEYYMLGD